MTLQLISKPGHEQLINSLSVNDDDDDAMIEIKSTKILLIDWFSHSFQHIFPSSIENERFDSVVSWCVPI